MGRRNSPSRPDCPRSPVTEKKPIPACTLRPLCPTARSHTVPVSGPSPRLGFAALQPSPRPAPRLRPTRPIRPTEPRSGPGRGRSGPTTASSRTYSPSHPTPTRPTGAQRTRPPGARRTQPSGARRSQPTGAQRTQPTGAQRIRPTGARRTRPGWSSSSRTRLPYPRRRVRSSGDRSTHPEIVPD